MRCTRDSRRLLILFEQIDLLFQHLILCTQGFDSMLEEVVENGPKYRAHYHYCCSNGGPVSSKKVHQVIKVHSRSLETRGRLTNQANRPRADGAQAPPA